VVKPPAPDTGFERLVLEHAEELPPQQRVIADYLLDHLETVPFLSIPELARRTGVSEATVVRFAQRLGYEGFSELKMDLVELLKGRLAGADQVDGPEVADDVLESVASLETANIRASVDRLDRRSFQEVAEAIFRADHTYTFGMGVSAHLAELAAYSLVQVGVRAVALSTRFSAPAEQLVTLTERDLCLALSFPPYSRQTGDVLRESRLVGAATVLICDRLTAPAVRHARWVLPVKSDNLMFTNAIATVTVLCNALAAEIATAHSSVAIEAFSRINRVLTEEPTVTSIERPEGTEE
jgi:DNA-binding MurR/RpiR family transcriptional regulator